jgi:aspartate/glutamate racemase
MKTLGIIGGIAPASTIEYYRMLVAGYQERRSDASVFVRRAIALVVPDVPETRECV